jgi:hypothetical protein
VSLIDGTTDPDVLADLARGKLRLKLPALREALHGRFETEHAIIIGRILAHIDHLDEAIAELSTAIEAQITPLASAVDALCTIPGVQRRTAEVIIAETGGDMSVFPTAKHLASWAGVCPGNDESAGKRRSGKTRKDQNGCARTSSKPPQPPAARRTPTSKRNTNDSVPAADTRARSPPSRTPCSSRSGTSSPPARSTATQAATTSPNAIQTDAPGDSSRNSKSSDTWSRSKHQRQQRRTHSPPEPGFLFSSSDSPRFNGAKGARERGARLARRGGAVLARLLDCSESVRESRVLRASQIGGS